MKKLITLLLAASFLLAFSACGMSELIGIVTDISEEENLSPATEASSVVSSEKTPPENVATPEVSENMTPEFSEEHIDAKPDPEKPSVIAEGNCGSISSWMLMSDGVLIIAGKGSMGDWTAANGLDLSLSGGSNSLYSYVTSIIIEEGITKISPYAFSSCFDVKEIAISSTVREIGEYAFNDCHKLRNISVADSNLYFSDEDGALYSRDGFTLIKCPNTVSSFHIREGVTTIASCAFNGCNYLSSVTIPSSVISIEPLAFYGIGHLVSDSISIEVDSLNHMLYTLNGMLFQREPLTLLYHFDSYLKQTAMVPEETQVIGAGAFVDSDYLTCVAIPMSVTSIEENAFAQVEISKINYPGTWEEWQQIEIAKGNEGLLMGRLERVS